MLVEQMPERGRVGGLLAAPFLLLIAELTRKGEFIHVSHSLVGCAHTRRRTAVTHHCSRPIARAWIDLTRPNTRGRRPRRRRQGDDVRCSEARRLWKPAGTAPIPQGPPFSTRGRPWQDRVPRRVRGPPDRCPRPRSDRPAGALGVDRTRTPRPRDGPGSAVAAHFAPCTMLPTVGVPLRTPSRPRCPAPQGSRCRPTVPHPGATTAHIDACHRASCQPGPDTNLGRHPPPAAKSWSEGGSRSTGIPGAYPPRRLGRAATGNFRGDAWVVAKSTIMEYRSHSKSTVPITAGSVTDCPFYHLDAERCTMSSARRTSDGAGAATREWATSHR